MTMPRFAVAFTALVTASVVSCTLRAQGNIKPEVAEGWRIDGSEAGGPRSTASVNGMPEAARNVASVTRSAHILN